MGFPRPPWEGSKERREEMQAPVSARASRAASRGGARAACVYTRVCVQPPPVGACGGRAADLTRSQLQIYLNLPS